MAGATVQLYSSVNTVIGDSDDVLCGTAITNAAGNYSFSGLLSGLNYYEIFRTPVGNPLASGFVFTLQNVGSDPTKNRAPASTGTTSLYTISSGQTATVNAGLYGTAPTFGWAQISPTPSLTAAAFLPPAAW